MRILFSLILALLALTRLTAQKATPENVDSLVAIVGNMPDDSVKVNWLNDIARAYTESKPDLSIEYSLNALTLAERIKFGRGYAFGLYIQAYAYMVKDEQQGAIRQKKHQAVALLVLGPSENSRRI